MTIQFRFNPKKAAQAAAYLLSLQGGKERGLKLINLLFLADRRAFVGHGTPITGDEMLSMRQGPALREVLNLINGGSTFLDTWNSYVKKSNEYEVELAHPFDADEDTEELSRYEMKVLHEVQNESSETSSSLSKWLHDNVPEWQETDVTRPISFETVLKNSKVSDREIEQIREDAQYYWEVATLFHSK